MPSIAPKAAVYLVVMLLIAGFLGMVATGNVAPWRYSRHLQCENQADKRARQICESIERHVEYTCCGHAIFSPGFRSTLDTVVAVWCEQRIKGTDIEALDALSKSSDMRLQRTAESLLRLLTGHDQYGKPEADVSILNPSHPSYILRDGCNGQADLFPNRLSSWHPSVVKEIDLTAHGAAIRPFLYFRRGRLRLNQPPKPRIMSFASLDAARRMGASGIASMLLGQCLYADH